MKSELLTAILGSLTVVNYVIGFFFVMLAIIFKWSVKTRKGVKFSKYTPSKFSWAYWFENNLMTKLKSITAVVIAVYLTFRFASESLGQAFTYFLALLIGLSIDFIIDKLKKQSLNI